MYIMTVYLFTGSVVVLFDTITMVQQPMTVDEENQKRQTPLYRVCIIAFSIILLVLARRAMIRLNEKIYDIRSGFFPMVKRLIGIFILIVLIAFLILFVINLFGKQQHRSDNKKQ